MIKANELRSGNLVNISFWSWSDFIGLHKLKPDHIGLIDKGLIKAEPIPLTEEWLLKFGFEQDYMNGFEKNNLYITIWKHEPEPPSVSIGDDSKFDISIHFVHQLQNLYFALTGEELVINETIKA